MSEIKTEKEISLEEFKLDNYILMKQNSEDRKKISMQDQIIESLKIENEGLRKGRDFSAEKDRYVFFIPYICSYYGISNEVLRGCDRSVPLPFIRQITCYFLVKIFGLNTKEAGEEIGCTYSTVVTNYQKIEEIIERNSAHVFDREVLRDVLAHRSWIEKLKEI